MDDLIRREDAIDAVIERIKQIGYEGNPYVLSIRQAIRDIPSAEPPLDVWCDDCKEYDKEHHCCPRWNRVIRETLKDAQIIHCKECRQYEIFPNGANGNCKLNVDVEINFYPWDFCSNAERREDASD